MRYERANLYESTRAQKRAKSIESTMLRERARSNE